MRGVRLALLLATTLVVLDARAATAAPAPQPRDTVVATRPTLLAFFLGDASKIDSDPSGDLATVADDFAYYLGTIIPLLDSLGVQVHEALDSTVVLVEPPRRAEAFEVLGPDSVLVGYWLVGGGRGRRYLGGGVHTDVDLVPVVCEHFGLGLPDGYRHLAPPTAPGRDDK